MSTGRNGQPIEFWVGNIERRLENLEKETAQNFITHEEKLSAKIIKHDDEDTRMFQSHDERLKKMEIQAAVTVWKFAMIAAIASVAIGTVLQMILKKLGWL